MLNTESAYDTDILVYNRSPHMIQVTLLENMDSYRNNSPKRPVKNTNGPLILSCNSQACLKLPKVTNDEFYDSMILVNNMYFFVEFSEKKCSSIMFFGGYIWSRGRFNNGILITKNCQVTHLEDRNIDRNEYVDVYNYHNNRLMPDFMIHIYNPMDEDGPDMYNNVEGDV